MLILQKAMINLFEYDVAKDQKDSNTVVIKNRKSITSREITYRPYYILLKKFNPNTSTNQYFIAMLDEPDGIRKCSKTILDDYGRVRLYLNGQFNDIIHSSIIDDKYLKITKVESADNADIYLIEPN